MKPYVSFITLGAENVPALADFYESAFGWQPFTRRPEVVFFKLNGIVFAIFGREDLARDAGIESLGNGFKGSALAHNLSSEAEVDAAYAHVVAQGAKGVKPPQKTSWGGYAAYIADPEGHLWELAYNPFMQMDENGNIISMQAT